jgi:hypothetical protein
LFPNQIQILTTEFKAIKTLFSRRYAPVAYDPDLAMVEDDKESENNESLTYFQSLNRQLRRQARRRRLILLGQATMTISSIIFAVLGVWARVPNGAEAQECPKCYVDDAQCTIHLSTFCKLFSIAYEYGADISIAPLIDANVIEYETQYWPNNPTPDPKYHGPPTYERELAWDDLVNRKMKPRLGSLRHNVLIDLRGSNQRPTRQTGKTWQSRRLFQPYDFSCFWGWLRRLS